LFSFLLVHAYGRTLGGVAIGELTAVAADAAYLYYFHRYYLTLYNSLFFFFFLLQVSSAAYTYARTPAGVAVGELTAVAADAAYLYYFHR